MKGSHWHTAELQIAGINARKQHFSKPIIYLLGGNWPEDPTFQSSNRLFLK